MPAWNLKQRTSEKTVTGMEMSGCQTFLVIFVGSGFALPGYGIVAFAFWAYRQGQEGLGGAVLLGLMGGVFAAAGTALLWGCCYTLMSVQRLQTPHITVAGEPFSLGERFQVQFKQLAKKRVTVASVSLTLVCQEKVLYTGPYDQKTGRNKTETKTKSVFSEVKELTVSGPIHAKGEIRGELEFVIPEDAMHSLDTGGANIQWKLKIRTRITNWPDYHSEFDIQVAPRSIHATPDA